jgi:hypothetical protein
VVPKQWIAHFSLAGIMQLQAPQSAGNKTDTGLTIKQRELNSRKVSPSEITQNAAIDTAKVQAISTIISRMGARLAEDIEKGAEMRY